MQGDTGLLGPGEMARPDVSGLAMIAAYLEKGVK